VTEWRRHEGLPRKYSGVPLSLVDDLSGGGPVPSATSESYPANAERDIDACSASDSTVQCSVGER